MAELIPIAAGSYLDSHGVWLRSGRAERRGESWRALLASMVPPIRIQNRPPCEVGRCTQNSGLGGRSQGRCANRKKIRYSRSDGLLGLGATHRPDSGRSRGTRRFCDLDGGEATVNPKHPDPNVLLLPDSPILVGDRQG